MSKQMILILFGILTTNCALCAADTKKILHAHPSKILIKLHRASKENNIPIARSSLGQKIDPNAQDGSGYTSLDYATSLEMVELLVSQGARFMENAKKENFLHIAVADKKPVELFLYACNNGVSPRKKELVHKNTPLHTLIFSLCDKPISSQSESEVAMFLQKTSILLWFGARLDSKNKYQKRPIDLLSAQCPRLAITVNAIAQEIPGKKAAQMETLYALFSSIAQMPNSIAHCIGAYSGQPALALSDLR